MAFENKNLAVIAYANGWTLWHYKTEDKIETVKKDGYFNRIETLCATGDIIIINACDDIANIRYIKIEDGTVKTTKIA